MGQSWNLDVIPYDMNDSATRTTNNINEVHIEHQQRKISRSSPITSESCVQTVCSPPNLPTLSEDNPQFQQSHIRKRKKESYCQPQTSKVSVSESIMMTFYPRMPGNSLITARAEKKKSSGKGGLHVSDNRLHVHGSPYLVGAVQQNCVARTLSSIIDEWNSVHGSGADTANENEGWKDTTKGKCLI